MGIGQRIKKTREKLGIPQAELARMVGITKQSLYKYENSIITNIPSSKIEAIANTLDTTPAYLMGWDDNYNEETIKKEDAVSDIFIRLRNDDKFYEAAQKLYNLNDKQLDAVIAMLSSFEQD